MLCPCHSSKPYSECCKPFHAGLNPSNALQLMRSRYCAYAMGISDYIIETTHPSYENYESDLNLWRLNILQFSQNTDFKGLTILEFSENANEAFVTFKATLFQEGKDVSFIEKSQFEKVNGRWLYKSAVYIRPVVLGN